MTFLRATIPRRYPGLGEFTECLTFKVIVPHGYGDRVPAVGHIDTPLNWRTEMAVQLESPGGAR